MFLMMSGLFAIGSIAVDERAVILKAVCNVLFVHADSKHNYSRMLCDRVSRVLLLKHFHVVFLVNIDRSASRLKSKSKV